MSIPTFTMRQLMEAGVHYGHHTRRWNPKMAPFIFGVREGVHILDLSQTVPALNRALEAIREVSAKGGKVLQRLQMAVLFQLNRRKTGSRTSLQHSHARKPHRRTDFKYAFGLCRRERN